MISSDVTGRAGGTVLQGNESERHTGASGVTAACRRGVTAACRRGEAGEEGAMDSHVTEMVLFVLSANRFLKQNPLCGQKSLREAFQANPSDGNTRRGQ